MDICSYSPWLKLHYAPFLSQFFFILIPFEVVPCLSFLSRDELFYLAPLRKFRVEACKFGRKNVELFLPLDSLVTSEVRKSVTRSCTWVIYFYLSKKEEERGRGWSKCYTWSQPLNSIPLPSKYYGAYGAKYMFLWARIGSTPSLSNNYRASYGIKKKMKQLEIISEVIENKYQLLRLSSSAHTPPRLMLHHSLDG